MATLDDLQTNLVNATTAMTNLSNTVLTKMSSIDSTVNSKITELNSWKISFSNSYSIALGTVLEVGVGKQFNTIEEAWYYCSGKNLLGPVTIKVADGTYITNSVWLGHQPYGSRISIIGNITNPENCIIKFVPDNNGQSHGVLFDGKFHVIFSGFKITGSLGGLGASHETHRGIYITNGANVESHQNSIIIDGAMCGIEVHNGAKYSGDYLRISNVARGITVNGNSRLSAGWANISSTLKIGEYFISRNGSKHDVFGIDVTDAAVAGAGFSIINGFNYGIHASNNSYVWADCVKISNAVSGIFAERNSTIWAHSRFDENMTPTDRTIISNCKHGFFAADNTFMLLRGALVENASINAYTAVSTSNLWIGDAGCTNCVNGLYLDTLSYAYCGNAAKFLADMKVTTGNKVPFAANTLSTSGSYWRGD